MLDEAQLIAARRVLSQRTVNGKPLSFADLSRMVEEEFDQSGLGDLVREMPDVKPPSVYFGDLHEADNWVWKYQQDIDEWWFFADDYEPATSIKIVRTSLGYPVAVRKRKTTMPVRITGILSRIGLTLFDKSDADVFCVAIDEAVVMRMAGLHQGAAKMSHDFDIPMELVGESRCREVKGQPVLQLDQSDTEEEFLTSTKWAREVVIEEPMLLEPGRYTITLGELCRIIDDVPPGLHLNARCICPLCGQGHDPKLIGDSGVGTEKND